MIPVAHDLYSELRKINSNKSVSERFFSRVFYISKLGYRSAWHEQRYWLWNCIELLSLLGPRKS